MSFSQLSELEEPEELSEGDKGAVVCQCDSMDQCNYQPRGEHGEEGEL
jgi:hypothetical protein